jgi:asparagine synthase (glutamine-hydrolysing)
MSWSPGDRDAQHLVWSHLDRLERSGGWRRVFEEAGFALALPVRAPPPVRRLTHGRGVVLGDLFPRRPNQAAPGQLLALSPDHRTSEAVCRKLMDDYWGRYVVIHQERPDLAPRVFRDPSGALDCLIWKHQGLTLIGGDLSEDLLGLPPSDLSLDWPTVGRFLGDPATIGARLGLQGAASVVAGKMAAADGSSAAALWTPRDCLKSERAPLETAKSELVRQVDWVVAAFARTSRRILAEVSGGLDSAIVAAALQHTGPSKVVQWLNYHIGEPQGDERVFARAVADQLGLVLTEAFKPQLVLTEDHLMALGGGARPSVAAIDFHYDQDNRARCEALNVDTIMTGQGGDTVFFQTRTPLVAADALRAGLPPKGLWGVTAGVAGWTRTSIWSVARKAALAGVGLGDRRLWRASPFLSRDLAAQGWPGASHPWLANLDRAPPAKRLQIHGLASAQLFYGDSRRGEIADLIHPLLAQPLVELCLGLPTFDLTRGRRDRALAREAFAGRLPPAVLERRSKGDLTAYYGRMLSRSLTVLRPFLIDGLLARERLVDKAALEAILNPDALIVRDATPDLVELIAIEAWARRWDQTIRNRPGAPRR